MPLTKDPDATLDFPFDWSVWLDEGVTIASHEVEVVEGDVVIDSVLATPTAVVVRLSGGTLGTTSRVRCTITDSIGQIEDEVIAVLIRNDPVFQVGCEPWPVIGCDIDSTNAAVYDAAKSAAQQFLNAATGGRFGACVYSERYQAGTLFRSDCGPYRRGDGLCCAIPLAHTPVLRVLEVRVDDAVLASNAYTIIGGNKLVRSSGCWPASLDCAPGRVHVSYQAGVPLRPPIMDGDEVVVPASAYYGMVGGAMGELTREYVKSMCGNECKLPGRFHTVNRQGVNTAGLDPTTFLRLGLTGLPMTDALVRTVNPNGLRRRPRVHSVTGPRRR